MKHFLFIVLIFAASCTNSSNKTAESKQAEIIPDSTRKLESNEQTLRLEYMSWFCSCANWATPSDLAKYKDTGKLSDHCIFIEPANSSLDLPDTIGYSADAVQFTGSFYLYPGFPKGFVQSEDKAEKAKVFRYTAFKILRSNYRNFIPAK